jgi:hypothetical protein
MRTSGPLLEIAVIKVHDGGTIWTTDQLLQMAVTQEMSCVYLEERKYNYKVLLLNF